MNTTLAPEGIARGVADLRSDRSRTLAAAAIGLLRSGQHRIAARLRNRQAHGDGAILTLALWGASVEALGSRSGSGAAAEFAAASRA